MSKVILGVFTVTLLAAGAFVTERAEAAAPAADACIKVFQRQRTCTEVFIPALVDLRVSLDKPKGFAARVKADIARWGPVVKASGFVAED